MSAEVDISLASTTDEKDHVDKRLDLARRFTLAGFEDTRLFDDIPRDVVLFLLPDDDPEFVQNELLAGLDSARHGHDVYFRHVRPDDLPK